MQNDEIQLQHPKSRLLTKNLQDFLIKAGIKQGMHLWEISVLSLNNVILRPAKIINRVDKNWAHSWKTKYFKNQIVQKKTTNKS